MTLDPERGNRRYEYFLNAPHTGRVFIPEKEESNLPGILGSVAAALGVGAIAYLARKNKKLAKSAKDLALKTEEIKPTTIKPPEEIVAPKVETPHVEHEKFTGFPTAARVVEDPYNKVNRALNELASVPMSSASLPVKSSLIKLLSDALEELPEFSKKTADIDELPYQALSKALIPGAETKQVIRGSKKTRTARPSKNLKVKAEKIALLKPESVTPKKGSATKLAKVAAPVSASPSVTAPSLVQAKITKNKELDTKPPVIENLVPKKKGSRLERRLAAKQAKKAKQKLKNIKPQTTQTTPQTTEEMNFSQEEIDDFFDENSMNRIRTEFLNKERDQKTAFQMSTLDKLYDKITALEEQPGKEAELANLWREVEKREKIVTKIEDDFERIIKNKIGRASTSIGKDITNKPSTWTGIKN